MFVEEKENRDGFRLIRVNVGQISCLVKIIFTTSIILHCFYSLVIEFQSRVLKTLTWHMKKSKSKIEEDTILKFSQI